ncbi:HNH endonuclease [Streptomyces virginiae]|uniref:HNH endonuclease n=1 Tax=Streptomyces virginiae TaxID=1961 RepID=UPI00363F6615
MGEGRPARSVEQVAFDTALIAAAMSSREQDFSERTHAGSEIREFLLAKWERSCAYCGATGVLLNIEHVRPRSRGGSDRVAHLVIACVPCNQAKGTARIDVATHGVAVHTWSGGRTAWNRLASWRPSRRRGSGPADGWGASRSGPADTIASQR